MFQNIRPDCFLLDVKICNDNKQTTNITLQNLYGSFKTKTLEKKNECTLRATQRSCVSWPTDEEKKTI